MYRGCCWSAMGRAGRGHAAVPRFGRECRAANVAVAVQPAFLELQEPTIEQGIERLAAQGVRRVVVVPLLLFAAGHAKRDVPDATIAALDRHGMTASRTERAGMRAGDSGTVPSTVSGGGYLASYRHQPRRPACCWLVAAARTNRRPPPCTTSPVAAAERGGIHTEVAFLAMAKPSLAEQLSQIAAAGFRRVIVQPHLLFQGELASSLARQVAAQNSQARESQIEWLRRRFWPIWQGRRVSAPKPSQM